MNDPRTAPALAATLEPQEGETLSVVGEHVRMLADARSTGGRLCVFVETTRPGAGPPLHRHEHDDEYFYVLEGRFRFVLDGREFFGEAGAFVAAPRGSLHAFCNAGDAPGRLLIVCTPGGLEVAFRAASANPDAKTPEALARLFEGLVRFEGPPIGPGAGA